MVRTDIQKECRTLKPSRPTGIGSRILIRLVNVNVHRMNPEFVDPGASGLRSNRLKYSVMTQRTLRLPGPQVFAFQLAR